MVPIFLECFFYIGGPFVLYCCCYSVGIFNRYLFDNDTIKHVGT